VLSLKERRNSSLFDHSDSSNIQTAQINLTPKLE